jgi:hypothetical protein
MLNLKNKRAYLLILAVTMLLSHNFSKLLFLSWNKTSISIIIFIFSLLGYINLILRTNSEKMNNLLLYIIIATIPFPYLVQFIGKDAITLTSVMIFFLISTLIIYNLIKKSNLSVLELDFVLPLLLLVCFTFTLMLNRQFLGQSFRHYIGNVSGIILYFIIVIQVKYKTRIITIIKIMVITMVIQAVISFTQIYFHNVYDAILQVFGAQGFDSRVFMIENSVRVSGTVWDYELLSELFLVGALLSVALIYVTGKYLHVCSLLCCLAGMIFTKTRSSIMLFSGGFVVTLIFLNLFRKDFKAISVKIAIVIGLGMAVFTVLFPDQISAIFERLAIYFQGSEHFSAKAVNRTGAWNRGIDLIAEHVSAFGNGFYNVENIYKNLGSFHSLYLTLLYKIGFVGSAVYVIFWLRLIGMAVIVLVRDKWLDNWHLIFFLFLSTILLLIDGIKIEYIRHGHFIQFVWTVFALLTVSFRQDNEDYKHNIIFPT